MDALDQLLLDAWNRVSERIRRYRVLALRRSRRRLLKGLNRPMREWCLVIRASDTRINDFSAIVEPRRAIERHEQHTITLDGKLIRRLTMPVTIPWPGVTYPEAARLLGRTNDSLYEWVTHGAFRVDRYREFKYPDTHKRVKGGRPYVWTPSPIDPNNFHGRTPHPMWGTLWQWQWEKLPENYELVVERVPRWRTQGGVRKHLGWEFICPGKLNERGEYSGCGRRCTYLYAPQTVWTLARAIVRESDDDGGFEMPEGSGLSGRWHPGLSDPIQSRPRNGLRSFACKTCWGVHSAVMANASGWNDFITHISGGLLRGRDVPRPLDLCPIARRKRRYTRKPKADSRAKVGALRSGEHAAVPG